jgi:hypothetical protein
MPMHLGHGIKYHLKSLKANPAIRPSRMLNAIKRRFMADTLKLLNQNEPSSSEDLLA